MTKQEAKELIVDITKKLYAKNMLNQFEGNISVRFEDRYLITPSQADKATLSADMIVEIDEEGHTLNPECGRHASSEYRMHLQAYRVRPDINAVIHDHSAYATAYAVAGQPITTCAFAELLEIFQEVPVVPYGTPGTPEIGREFARYLPEHDAVLLENHGLLAVASQLPLAFSIAEAVEKIAKTLLFAKLLGGEKPLPAEEVARLRAMARERRAKPQ